MKHMVYLELFGKKMKVSIESNSKQQAMQIVKEKIKFHKIEVDKNTKNNQFEDILNILGL